MINAFSIFFLLLRLKRKKEYCTIAPGMKKIILNACFFLVCMSSNAQKWNQAYQTYIDTYKDVAIEEMERYHIPASITLAQGLFESNAGRSDLVRMGNNHFGIKCHGWNGETITHDDDAKGECFRAYDNALQSFEDHSRFLITNQRYSRLFSLPQTDYKNWATGLRECGYATNPQYGQRLIAIIELYHLDQYDKAKDYDRFIARHGGEDMTVVNTRTNKKESLHPIKIFNSNYYLIARDGDTFKSIGEEVGISGRKLATYNEREYHDALYAGDIVFLKKKKKKAPKSFKNKPHVVKNGESLYSICQMYGMRLKTLYKLNKLTPLYHITAGDVLRVR